MSRPVGSGPQEPTLSEARHGPNPLVSGRSRLSISRFLWWHSFDAMSESERKEWYLEKLGSYENQLEESAARNGIPAQILAVVILNELADINLADTVQENLSSTQYSGSFGIAQIQVRTAVRHKLLDGYVTGSGPGRSQAVIRLLQIPQYAIEAAAREIRHLLDEMEKDPTLAWPARFQFTPPKNGRGDPDSYFDPGVVSFGKTGSADATESEEARFVVFAFMIVAAYNGGDGFLRNKDPQNEQPNSWLHGQNGAVIAQDLHRMGLFEG